MTDNEIIKALEYCFTNDFGKSNCNKCMFYTATAKCMDDMQNAVIDLINRQKAEIEELKAKIIADDKLLNDRVQEAVNFVSKANQKYVDALEKAFNDKVAELKTAKSEAIKDFAERLKECSYTYSDICGYKSTVIDVADIENLVKEMCD